LTEQNNGLEEALDFTKEQYENEIELLKI